MFLILFTLQIAFLVSATDENHSDSEKKLVPNLTFKDFNNKKVKLDQFYENGPILVNFWTLSCEPCKKEMKHLSKLNTKYSEYGFKVLSINMDSPRTLKKVKQFTKSQKYTFQILSDPRMELFRKLGGSVMPLVVFINTDGTIESKHIGYNPGDESLLEKEIIDIISSNSSDSQIQNLKPLSNEIIVE
ncbi:MAG: hypothetical protein CMG59_05760 [Candidatus Marinimicrobia bacterium]|nr:hypothetical protein [Candidatus Neomarinimicrobiota bacterium]|tara:strand:+ start:1011 stop:1574 length:564 start_codon:yes stop_codon:yes gene_type:complete